MLTIDLSPTRALHEELSRYVPDHANRCVQGIQQANQNLRHRGITFGGEKEMPIALSALLLGRADIERLAKAARQLHDIIEKTLDWLIASPTRLEDSCGDHRRVFPYLQKTVGSSKWQLFSRYDVVLGPGGSFHFIECNTGCPAGFMHAVDFSVETRLALRDLDGLKVAGLDHLGMIRPSAMIDLIERVERRSGLEPGLIGIMTDENNLKLELDLIERGLAERRRLARIIDARTLTWDGSHLRHGDERVSVAFNKVRISTPASPNHCWRAGFEDRYASLLRASQQGRVAMINNIAALTIAEDKGLLAFLHSPLARTVLSAEERAFVEEAIPWTCRLDRGRADRRGQTIDLLPTLSANKDGFVLKPANEGRGFEVHIGKETSQMDWDRLLEPIERLPMVAQEFIEPVSLPVACLRDGEIRWETMHLTIALAMLDGVYEGILSRISPAMVTNVGRQGFVQAVFVH
jgi:hypothetical protein